MNNDEKYIMIQNMQKYGGSFVVALSECFAKADHVNFAKLSRAFPEYVEKYRNFGKSNNEKDNKNI